MIDISLTVSPMRNAAGQIVGASKISRDISDRRGGRGKAAGERAAPAGPARRHSGRDLHHRRRRQDHLFQPGGGRARRPHARSLGSDEWCVTWKLYWPDGTPLPHDQCPMAVALKEGRAIRNAEAIAERPDGTPRAVHSLSDAAAGCQRQRRRRHQHAGRRQRAQAGGNASTRAAQRAQSSRQEQHADDAVVCSIPHRGKSATPEAQKVLDEASRAGGRDGGRAAGAVRHHPCDPLQMRRNSSPRFARPRSKPSRPSVKIVCGKLSGELSNDDAMPLALILNELLTNAAKHGANGRGETIIRAGLCKRSRRLCLVRGRRRTGFRPRGGASAVIGPASGAGPGSATPRTFRSYVQSDPL